MDYKVFYKEDVAVKSVELHRINDITYDSRRPNYRAFWYTRRWRGTIAAEFTSVVAVIPLDAAAIVKEEIYG